VKSIPGRVHLCLEEGTQSAWLYELFSPHVAELVVTVAPENKGAKDDLRDAWARAEELRTGSIRTRVYKAPLHLAALRNAVRGYGFAVRDVVRAMCRLRSVFLSRGVAVNDGVYNPKGRVKWLAKLTPPHRRLAEWLGRQLDQLVPLREEAEKWLIEEAKTHPIIRKLATAPGMGPIRTAQVVAITANPHRFRTRRQYWSYCGFGIVTRSSSDWVQTKDGRWERSQVHQTRGLTRKRHPLLKAVFKGAATTVITQLPEHPLHKDYERMLAAGIKPNLAKLTLARKIAATVLSMWKHQEVYDPQRHRAVSDKT
jgi:transposase